MGEVGFATANPGEAQAPGQVGIRKELSAMDNPVFDRIKQDVTDNDVVVYMKGSPVFPQCGFSAAVVQVLSHLGVQFKGIDVLTDPSLRQGIKDYSSWPTIPQLYVKGEFVGGCDIVREMFQTGELMELFSTRGIEVRPAA
jgi:monothiol glutaredoxin